MTATPRLLLGALVCGLLAVGVYDLGGWIGGVSYTLRECRDDGPACEGRTLRDLEFAVIGTLGDRVHLRTWGQDFVASDWPQDLPLVLREIYTLRVRVEPGDHLRILAGERTGRRRIKRATGVLIIVLWLLWLLRAARRRRGSCRG